MKVNDVTLSATGGDPEKSQERSRTPCEASRSVCGVQNRFIDFPALHTEYADYLAAECDPRDYFGCCQIFICALTLRVNFIVTRRVCDLSLPGGRLGCHHRRWRCSAGSRRHRRPSDRRSCQRRPGVVVSAAETAQLRLLAPPLSPLLLRELSQSSHPFSAPPLVAPCRWVRGLEGRRVGGSEGQRVTSDVPLALALGCALDHRSRPGTEDSPWPLQPSILSRWNRRPS